MMSQGHLSLFMDTCLKCHGKGDGDQEKRVGVKKQTLQHKREQVTRHPEG